MSVFVEERVPSGAQDADLLKQAGVFRCRARVPRKIGAKVRAYDPQWFAVKHG
jgi:hypothetical protein